MIPNLWPSRLNYSQESVSPELHLSLFRNFFPVADQDHNIHSSLIEQGLVHPDLILKEIDASFTVNGKPHPLSCQKTAKGHTNYGVFASKAIPANTPLGEYICELYLLPNPCLLDPFLEKHPYREYTWFIKANDLIVILDASERSNELALVNSYIGINERPNVRMGTIVHNGAYYFGYITTHDINEGEEILADYGNKHCVS
jgi:SET domain-containing protein